MAPRKKKAAKTVVTAKRVVEETLELVVSSPEQEVELISSSTKENEKIEISTPKNKPHKKKTASPPPPLDDDETQPASEPITAPTPPRKEAPARKRRRRKLGGGGGEGYGRYLYLVLKQVHPEMGISAKAMTVVNNLMVDMFERMAEEAGRLGQYTGRRTLSSREVQGAVKLLLPGELGKHAMSEATKAISNYVSYKS